MLKDWSWGTGPLKTSEGELRLRVARDGIMNRNIREIDRFRTEKLRRPQSAQVKLWLLTLKTLPIAVR